MAEETLQGTVNRVTFHNPESGFCVLRVQVKGKREDVTVVGSSVSVQAGESIECQGQWTQDKLHGLQFKATTLNLIQPTSLEGIEKYLGSGLIKGIGPGFAKRMIQAFGADVFTVIEEKPHLLQQLPGFGEKRCAQITRGWDQQKKVREIVVFLHAHGIGTSRAVRIYKQYRDQAIEKIKENPYCLARDIRGIGFKTADQLAQSLGVPPHALFRAQAGIHHVLQECTQKGDCGATVEALIQTTQVLLNTEEEIIQTAIQEELNAKRVVAETFSDKPGIMLASYHQAECSISKKLRQLMQVPALSPLNLEDALKTLTEQHQITLSNSQAHAVQIALENPITLITGGPGVGKTTVIKSILKIIESQVSNILLCAPTGRAAKRLSESTGREAKTLHRLLGYDPKTHGFQHHEQHLLVADLIVMDEVSMVDLLMMHHFLKAVPKACRLIFVGDVDQLPSVGAGAVLANLIDSNAIPTVRLTEIFRQAADSHIIRNAHRINQGYFPKIETDSEELRDFYFIPCDTAEAIQEKLNVLIKTRIPQRFQLDPIRDIQVLAPMNRGNLGTQYLNMSLKKTLNLSKGAEITRYGTSYSQGDKVIQTVNNYDKEVFNGDIGFIQEVDLENSVLQIEFDHRIVEYDFDEVDELSLAYAISIHKSQGSEYPAVIIPLAMQHYTLLQRNLIYTAVTRGKKLVVVLGQKRALFMAIQNNKAHQRLTKLCERMQETIS